MLYAVSAPPGAHRDLTATSESLEVRLFEWGEVPWDELAFPTVRWALEHAREQGVGAGAPWHVERVLERTKLYVDGAWVVRDG